METPTRDPHGSAVPVPGEVPLLPANRPPAPAPAVEDLVGLAVRLEPIGPTTELRVPRSARIEEVKDEALRKLNVPPAVAQRCVIAKDGRLLDEGKRVGEYGFSELAFLSVGLLDDVYIEDRDWRTGGP